jgi:hypothetical protein
MYQTLQRAYGAANHLLKAELSKTDQALLANADAADVAVVSGAKSRQPIRRFDS